MFRDEFEEQLKSLIDKEVLTRITEAVENPTIIPGSGGEIDPEQLKCAGDALLKKLEPKAAAMLVMHLIKYMLENNHIKFYGDDSMLWEGWGETEVMLKKYDQD